MHVWIVLGVCASLYLFWFYSILFELKRLELQSVFEMWATCTFTMLQWNFFYFPTIASKFFSGVQYPQCRALNGVDFGEVHPSGSQREDATVVRIRRGILVGLGTVAFSCVIKNAGPFVVHEWCSSSWKNFLAGFGLFCLLVLFAPRVQGRGLN